MEGLATVDRLARALHGVEAVLGRSGRPEYRVAGRWFAALRPPRGDALDPVTGEPLDDVLLVAVGDLGAKAAFLADAGLACFTTPHFEGYSAVLHRLSDIESVDEERLAALLQHAWEVRAPARLRRSARD